MGTALIVDAVVDAGKIRILDEDYYRTKAARAAKKWGDGTPITVRIEPTEDAIQDSQRNHYWGHIITPLSEWNGEWKEDWHLRLKSEFMPEGKTSIMQLTKEEMREYILRCEVYAYTAHPEAFALEEPRSVRM